MNPIVLRWHIDGNGVWVKSEEVIEASKGPLHVFDFLKCDRCEFQLMKKFEASDGTTLLAIKIRYLQWSGVDPYIMGSKAYRIPLHYYCNIETIAESATMLY